MNRDELLSRGPAQPPRPYEIHETLALFPLDIEGGTWIAATEAANCFALLNRNGGSRSPSHRSRGELITHILDSGVNSEAEFSLRHADLRQYLPFRLIGIFSSAMHVFEWTWDGQRLATIAHGWQPRHWFSSGVSDEKATRSRSSVFESAWKEAGAGNAEWLRRVHRSHGDSAGAFTVCVHREDAASVSYTEVLADQSRISMSYQPGSPCNAASMSEIVISRRHTAPEL